MSFEVYQLTKGVVDSRLEERRREAATRHLLRQAGVECGWLSPLVRRWLCRLGHLLISLGERLERRSLPSCLPLEGRAGTGGCQDALWG